MGQRINLKKELYKFNYNLTKKCRVLIELYTGQTLQQNWVSHHVKLSITFFIINSFKL